MSFLMPLYIAGLAAITLPILFHLIRRTPQGRQTFSSLMFLSPSPPRITKRSRLNNVLLLLLRAIALALLAFAFARPLLRQDADLDVTELQGRRIVLLVDTSASMQRGDLWKQALLQVDKILSEASAADELALYTFDRDAQQRMTFSEWNGLERSRRAPVLQARLADQSPSWAATNLGDALAAAADALADSSDAKESTTAGRQVVLISDLQQGSRLESLQGYQWPEGVLLEVKPVTLRDSANAGVSLVKDAVDTEEEQQDGRLRIRVSNQPESMREQLTLAWANAQGPLKDVDPIGAYVPPASSRIVRVDWPARELSADRLILGGDDFDFDNTLYLIRPRQETVRVVYIGDDAAEDAQGLHYFLTSALPETPNRKVELLARTSQAVIDPTDLLDARLVVVSANVSSDQAKALRRHVEEGGLLLFVSKDASAVAGLARLLGLEELKAEESVVWDYALLAQIDFGHPLFAPFSDPRFADFTKIRFWKHRRITIPTESSARVLAKFDNSDPFLIEQSLGKGRLLAMTSGWHPADSQLALSTKFVPLIGGLLERPQPGYEQAQHTVFDALELPPAESGPRQMTDPSGHKLELPPTATTVATEQPGIYRLSFADREIPLAVNLDADESRTAPLAVEELESRGARLGSQPTQQELQQRQRQLRLIELENRQKLWRWLIVAVLAVLVIETALAGGLAHRTVTQQVTS